MTYLYLESKKQNKIIYKNLTQIQRTNWWLPDWGVGSR